MEKEVSHDYISITEMYRNITTYYSFAWQICGSLLRVLKNNIVLVSCGIVAGLALAILFKSPQKGFTDSITVQSNYLPKGAFADVLRKLERLAALENGRILAAETHIPDNL